MDKGKAIILTILVVPIITGVTISIMLEHYIRGESVIIPEKITRFYVVNESGVSLERYIQNGESLLFRIIIENQENMTITYRLNVALSGNNVYNETMVLDNGQTLNKTISFRSNINDTNIYSKLEFLLYKNDIFYKNVVYQIMTGNITRKTEEKVENSILESNKSNISSVSNIEYKIQRIGDTVVYVFDSGEILELNITNISFNFTNDIVKDKSIIENTIIYTFITEDKFKLNINDSENIIEPHNAIYITNVTDNNIIFLKDKYERTVPNRVNYLSFIINETKNKTLNINETLNIKNNWSIVLNDINDRGFKLKIIKNNRGRDIIYNKDINDNRPIEYWEDVDEFKRQKMIQIDILKINNKNITVNVTQYDENKIITLGDRYGEFQVTNITEDSIIMKNSIPIKIENRNVLSLMNSKMKIMV